MAGYPLLLAAVLAAVAQHARGVRLTMGLDGLAGALAGGAVAALVLAPLLPALQGLPWLTVVTLAYPLVDGVLLSVALGGLALLGAGGHSRRFGLWVLGLLGLSVAHLLEAHQVALASVLGTVAGAGTAELVLVLPSLTLLAAGALGPGTVAVRRVPGARSLGVPALASTAAVAVLAVAPPWGVWAIPSLLALAALVACGARFLWAFLQLRELAEVRELALTDDLTGVANRRALYVHLDTLLALDEGAAEGDDPGAPSFGVALIDLDHFKEVNDTLGHAAGDELLKVRRRAVHRRADGAGDAVPARPPGRRRVRRGPARGGHADAALIVGQALHERCGAAGAARARGCTPRPASGWPLAPDARADPQRAPVRGRRRDVRRQGLRRRGGASTPRLGTRRPSSSPSPRSCSRPWSGASCASATSRSCTPGRDLTGARPWCAGTTRAGDAPARGGLPAGRGALPADRARSPSGSSTSRWATWPGGGERGGGSRCP